MSQLQPLTPRADARGVGRLLLLAAVSVAVVGPLATAPAATAAPTICVALVVDFTPLNGGVDSGCTRVPKGANGYDVLRAGGHTFEICANGIVGTIDGKPANGCQIKDNTHFWGYWHRKPGSRTWTFSSFGAGGYHPVEGSTEGWVWENGKTSPPADTTYPAGCHSPPASSSPTPRPSARSSSAAGGATAGGSSGAGSAPATSGPVAAGRTQASAGPSGRHDRSRHRASASVPAERQAATPSASTGSTTPTPAPTSTKGVLSGAPPDTGGGGGHVAPLAAGLGAAALLGVGAWWRSRRSGITS